MSNTPPSERVQNINERFPPQRSIQSHLAFDSKRPDYTSICRGGLYLKIAIHVNLPMLDKPWRARDMPVNGRWSKSRGEGMTRGKRL